MTHEGARGVPGFRVNIVRVSWIAGDVEKSLAGLYRYSEAEARKASDWHCGKKGGPARMSRLLGVIAAVLLILGRLAAIVKSAFPALASRSGPDVAQLGYVFLAGAAACIGADKYLGYSSSWSRNILA